MDKQKVGILVEFTVTYSGYYQIEADEDATLDELYRRADQERERWNGEDVSPQELLEELCGSYSEQAGDVEIGLE